MLRDTDDAMGRLANDAPVLRNPLNNCQYKIGFDGDYTLLKKDMC